jgi:hypothetical protein
MILCEGQFITRESLDKNGTTQRVVEIAAKKASVLPVKSEKPLNPYQTST